MLNIFLCENGRSKWENQRFMAILNVIFSGVPELQNNRKPMKIAWNFGCFMVV